MEWVFTLEKIHIVAEEFLAGLDDHQVIAVHGPMGVGKTSFIHAVADNKKVEDIVGSPSFSIINEYVFLENGTERRMFHIDLYRLEDEKEAMNAGVEDCLYRGDLCFVEWPERAPGLFPDDTIHIYIDLVNEHTRRLRIGNN